MSLFSRVILRSCRAIELFAEDPKLLQLRFRGVLIDLYKKLNQEWLIELNIATILDIGASTGEYALTLHQIFPQAMIYSFEPLPDSYTKLLKRMAHVPTFKGFNVGIGDQNAELILHRNIQATASSFLNAQEEKTFFPWTSQTTDITATVVQLDDICAELDIRTPLLVKIDVQGYEDKVLSGGKRTIQQADVIIIETSFEELYEGQALFVDLYHQLLKWDFNFTGVLEQHFGIDGQIIQADCIFVRRK